MLMMGPIADNMVMPPAVRERHEKLRVTSPKRGVYAVVAAEAANATRH
jgi:hypothetical protein